MSIVIRVVTAKESGPFHTRSDLVCVDTAVCKCLYSQYYRDCTVVVSTALFTPKVKGT